MQFLSRCRRSRPVALGAVVLALAGGIALGPLGMAAAAGNQLPRANWEWAGTTDGASIQISGWAFDPDAPTTSSAVHVYIDGGATPLVADRTRTDIGAAFPAAGSSHGFQLDLPYSPGNHTVCVYAIDLQVWWQNTPLGCRQVQVPLLTPVGNLEAVSGANGNVTVSGWAVDPNSSDPIEVHLYVGSYVRGGLADGARTDVQAVRGGGRSDYGFQLLLSPSPGVYPVCVYAIDNQFKWAHTLLGCRTVSVGMSPPVGQWESLTTSGTTFTVTGWTFDPDYPTGGNSSASRVFVDGALVGWVTDGDSRPDVWSVFPASGPMAGFHGAFTVAPGTHQVCVEAADAYVVVRNTPLGCRSITV